MQSNPKKLNLYIFISFIALFFFISFGIFTIVIIFVFFKNREKNSLRAFYENSEISKIEVLNGYFKSNDGNGNSLFLRDFYIASAFRPYQIDGETSGSYSLEAIKHVINKGAVFHFIDIWSSNPHTSFDDKSTPVVRNKILSSRREYGNPLNFDKVCEVYKKNYWNKNYVYPLILYLNLDKSAQNIYIENKIATSLFTYFNKKLLGLNYSFSKRKIGDIPMSDIKGKIIIITNIKPTSTYLDEITNGVINKDIKDNANLIEYDDLNNSYGKCISASIHDTSSLTDKNKETFGILIPKNINSYKNNFFPGFGLVDIPIHLDKKNPLRDNDKTYWFEKKSPFSYSFNIVCINYQKESQETIDYVEFFKKSSFILKPDNLRKPKNIGSTITKQNDIVAKSVIVKDGYFTAHY